MIMTFFSFLPLIIVAVAVALAVIYVVRSKKHCGGCIGCPYAKECSKGNACALTKDLSESDDAQQHVTAQDTCGTDG